ncbi:MAG: DUF4349 domain-containing protein [Gemmataceae bacterium]
MTMPRLLSWCAPLLLAVLIGCSGSSTSFEMPAKTLEGAAQPKPAAQAVKGNQAPEARKIIYTGRMEILVESFDDAVARLQQVVKSHEGYIARSEITGRPGEPRRGSWTLRIPVNQFDPFRNDLHDLGEVRRDTLDSEDITDRYYDLQAEMLNHDAREKALRKMYEEKIAGSKLSDLLEVDRELSSVRGQINQRKGQLQRWDKETAFATLHVDLFDRQNYVPPTAPDFGSSIVRTFWNSVNAIVLLGKNLVLAVVALAPWFAILALILGPVLYLIRRRRSSPPPMPPSR